MIKLLFVKMVLLDGGVLVYTYFKYKRRKCIKLTSNKVNFNNFAETLQTQLPKPLRAANYHLNHVSVASRGLNRGKCCIQTPKSWLTIKASRVWRDHCWFQASNHPGVELSGTMIGSSTHLIWRRLESWPLSCWSLVTSRLLTPSQVHCVVAVGVRFGHMMKLSGFVLTCLHFWLTLPASTTTVINAAEHVTPQACELWIRAAGCVLYILSMHL